MIASDSCDRSRSFACDEREALRGCVSFQCLQTGVTLDDVTSPNFCFTQSKPGVQLKSYKSSFLGLAQVVFQESRGFYSFAGRGADPSVGDRHMNSGVTVVALYHQLSGASDSCFGIGQSILHKQ